VKTRIGVVIAMLAAVTASAQTVAPDAEIRKILADRIDNQRQSVGIVVAVVEPSGRRVVAHGHFANGDARPVGVTGQPKLELFASGEREFFLKVVDAQLTMEVDAQGPATAVTLHQFGRDQRAPRIE